MEVLFRRLRRNCNYLTAPMSVPNLRTSRVKSKPNSLIGRAKRNWRERHATPIRMWQFNKQGNLYTRLVLGICKMSISVSSCHNLINLYRGFNWIPSRWSQQHIAFSKCPWKWFPLGEVGRTHITRLGDDLRTFW